MGSINPHRARLPFYVLLMVSFPYLLLYNSMGSIAGTAKLNWGSNCIMSWCRWSSTAIHHPQHIQYYRDLTLYPHMHNNYSWSSSLTVVQLSLVWLPDTEQIECKLVLNYVPTVHDKFLNHIAWPKQLFPQHS